MIASVRGEVTMRRADHVVVEAAGVGYRLGVSAHTLRAVPPVGDLVLLHAHLVVRDDGMHLYGFGSEDERALFLMLIGVQGVGPKVALAVLSGGSPRELLEAIAAGDSARFRSAPGIGRRTAERIIVELRPKVGEGEGPVAPGGDDVRATAREGLLGLGFSPQEVEDLLSRVRGDSPEALIAGALRAAR